MMEARKIATVVDLPLERRKVDLEHADETLLKIMIFHAMNEKRSLQDCLRESFGANDIETGELRKLYENAGLFDAARASATKQMKRG